MQFRYWLLGALLLHVLALNYIVPSLPLQRGTPSDTATVALTFASVAPKPQALSPKKNITTVKQKQKKAQTKRNVAPNRQTQHKIVAAKPVKKQPQKHIKKKAVKTARHAITKTQPKVVPKATAEAPLQQATAQQHESKPKELSSPPQENQEEKNVAKTKTQVAAKPNSAPLSQSSLAANTAEDFSKPVEMTFGSKNGPAFSRYISPQYPRRARRRGIEGQVHLRILVGTKGKAQKVLIVQSAGRDLDEAAVKSVLLAEFHPLKHNGIPRPSWTELPGELK